ncbi:MAG: DUF5320 domain-containing protein [Chloroflexi bacterium]|nr:DUF5320 domain-containing protein [Chloroflexota bacterium]
MPGGDRTGPWGAGPQTGRSRGYCAGYDAPGYAAATPGRGRRLGCDWRNRYYATGLPRWARPEFAPPAPAPETELAGLKAQAVELRAQLDAVAGRIEAIAGRNAAEVAQ